MRYGNHFHRFSSNSHEFFFIPGILLFHKLVHQFWTRPRKRQVCDHWYWCHNGGNDLGFHSVNGSNGKKNVAFVRTWRNVHIFHLYHHFVFDKGVLTTPIRASNVSVLGFWGLTLSGIPLAHDGHVAQFSKSF